MTEEGTQQTARPRFARGFYAPEPRLAKCKVSHLSPSATSQKFTPRRILNCDLGSAIALGGAETHPACAEVLGQSQPGSTMPPNTNLNIPVWPSRENHGGGARCLSRRQYPNYKYKYIPVPPINHTCMPRSVLRGHAVALLQPPHRLLPTVPALRILPVRDRARAHDLPPRVLVRINRLQRQHLLHAPRLGLERQRPPGPARECVRGGPVPARCGR